MGRDSSKYWAGWSYHSRMGNCSCAATVTVVKLRIKKENHLDSPFNMLCIDIRIGSILFDELSSRFHVVAHQHGEYLVSLGCVLDGDLLQ